MKYVCKDCGKEYLKRVEYCSCGNNGFEIVEAVIVENPSVDVGFEDTPKLKSPINKGLSISWAIFAVCIILSLYIISIPIKHNQRIAQEPEQNVKQTIPDIEKIWNGTPPAVPTKPAEVITEQKPETLLDRVMNKIEEPPFVKDVFKTNKTTTKPSQSTQNPTPKSNQNSNIKPVSSIQKPQTKPTQQATATKPTTSAQSNPKITQQTTSPKPAVQQTSTPKPIQQTVKKPTQQTTQNRGLEEVTLDNKNVQKPQIQTPTYDLKATANYESALLKKLYSKFAVGGLSGTGNCVVSFSVDRSGKLINRKFEQYSDNKTLNDAVYYMMMSSATFNTPPSGYYQRTLKVQVRFNNGEYSIGYI